MIDYSKFKIALSGGQGSGKTTLALAWADKYNVTLSKSDTRSIMGIFGFENHSQIVKAGVNTPSVGIEFQKALAIEKLKAFKETETGFISDRSLVDIFTYYAIHNSMFADEKVNEEMKAMLLESFNTLDLVVLVMPKLKNIEDNNVRCNNTVYYETVSSVMFSTLMSIISSIDDIQCNSFKVKSSDIITHLYSNSKVNILIVDESKCKGGIATVKQRIEVLEMALEDISR